MTATTDRTLRVLPAPPHGPKGVPLPTHAEAALRRPAPAPYVQDALAVDFAREPLQQVPGPVRDRDLPDPTRWAAHIGQALVEVMHGIRPAPQIMRWATPEVYALVARRGALAARRGARSGPAPRARVVRVRVCEPADDVAEASVVLSDSTRVRALALRLVGRDGRWLLEAFQIG